MAPRPIILERFFEPKSIQDRKKRYSKTLQKSTRNLTRFLTNFGSILDPMGTPKIKHFSLIFTLGATLRPSWRQEAPKVLQDGSRARFSKKIVPFWNLFSQDFVRFRSLFFIQFLINFQFHVESFMTFQQGCFNLRRQPFLYTKYGCFPRRLPLAHCD